jgi:glycine reductase complex component B subunit gamma
MPVAFITAMCSMGKQLGANRIITGTKIPHPCGDPTLSAEADRVLRREIVGCALRALQADLRDPTIFTPSITYTTG